MWEILGSDSQVLTVVLDPGELATCKPGAMITHDGPIGVVEKSGWFQLDIETKEKYANSSPKASMTFAAPFSGGKIIPIKLGIGRSMIIRPGAWLASKGVDVHFEFDESGLPMVSGTAPTFICGRGTIMSRMLARGESIVVRKSAFLACEGTVQIKVSWCALLFGCDYGLTGPGMVLLQSIQHVA